MTREELGNIPAELKSLRRWVCVEASSKVPLCPAAGRAASASDPETWSEYEEAADAVRSGRYDGLGFVFAPGDGLVGIDIDAGFDPDGLMSALCRDVVHACRSYTEKSRSGRGVHVIVRGSLPFSGRNGGEGVEIYRSGRYFIMTGRKLIYGDIAENQAGIDYVAEKYFGSAAGSAGDGAYGGRPARLWSPSWSPPEGGTVCLRPEYPAIPAGARNSSLFSYAGALRSAGYDEDGILKELSRANAAACSPPLPEGEIRRIAKGVMRYKR